MYLRWSAGQAMMRESAVATGFATFLTQRGRPSTQVSLGKYRGECRCGVPPHMAMESALYTERERAALAWTEALTKIADTHAPDAIYDEVRKHFSEDELVALSIAIGMINAWNRLSIGFRAQHPADVRRAA